MRRGGAEDMAPRATGMPPSALPYPRTRLRQGQGSCYDTAFDSRVWQVRFPAPDEAARAGIWRRHLPAAPPLAEDVSPEGLAGVDEVTGRDIRRAVIDAAAEVLRTGQPRVRQADLLAAVERIKAGRPYRAGPMPMAASGGAG